MRTVAASWATARALSGDRAGSLRVWDLHTGECIQEAVHVSQESNEICEIGAVAIQPPSTTGAVSKPATNARNRSNANCAR